MIRRGHWNWENALAFRVLRLLIATVIMALVLNYASAALSDWLAPQSPLLTQLSALMMLIGLAMVVYFSVAFLIGGADASMIRRNLKRKARAASSAES